METDRKQEFWRSPLNILMMGLGVALILGAVYFALQTLPGIANPVTGEAAAPKGDPNLGLPLDQLATLPPEIAASAEVILSQEEPQMPEPLLDLPVSTGGGLRYPVAEAVDNVQPGLSWTDFAPGPYKVTVADAAGKVVASVPNIRNLAVLVPTKLEPGQTYSWQVVSVSNETQQAYFTVLPADDAAEWRRLRAEYAEMPLPLGLAAEHFGLLTVAEEQYQALAKALPNAEAPARLYANVLTLRE
jgi:hypothetical protein